MPRGISILLHHDGRISYPSSFALPRNANHGSDDYLCVCVCLIREVSAMKIVKGAALRSPAKKAFSQWFSSLVSPWPPTEEPQKIQRTTSSDCFQAPSRCSTKASRPDKMASFNQQLDASTHLTFADSSLPSLKKLRHTPKIQQGLPPGFSRPTTGP
jgi:hypothetical protein